MIEFTIYDFGFTIGMANRKSSIVNALGFDVLKP